MNNQTAHQAVINNQDQAAGPVEIDVSLLERISGGFPKGTWRGGEPPVNATTGGAEAPFPKGTW